MITAHLNKTIISQQFRGETLQKRVKPSRSNLEREYLKHTEITSHSSLALAQCNDHPIEQLHLAANWKASK